MSYLALVKQDDVFYQAMKTRDHRFDGKFFVGVKTTGIYCRPICPAKPKRENVEFFMNALAAERAGYRPCLRCRPESAPQSPAWIGKSAVVQRAVKVLHNHDSLSLNEDNFAKSFGVTARHLRRLFVDEIGKTPKQLSFENRLNLSRKLIVETNLSMSQIAFSSGFRSIRRFNEAFRKRFKTKPTQIRRTPLKPDGLKISLPYRPPFNFNALLNIYRSHQVGHLEWFEEGKMHRLLEKDGKAGWVTISNDSEKSRLVAEIDFPNTSVIPSVVAKVRNLFDLDSDPLVIANSLELDFQLKRLLKKHPGIRLPSGWDGFEIAISAILGQLVSVERGRALVNDLILMLGEDSGVRHNQEMVKLFPTPQKISESSLTELKTTSMRKRTLIAFSKAILNHEISLEPTQDVNEFTHQVLGIPGIGPWTASYMALKILRHTDAFPHTDLILARALEIHQKAKIDLMSPWRGYAAALMWQEYTHSLKRRKQ